MKKKLQDADENQSFFYRCLLYSALAHFLVFVFFLIFSLWAPSPPPETRIMMVRLGGTTGEGEDLPFQESKTLPQSTIEEQKKASFEQPPPEKTPPPKQEEKKPVGEEKDKVSITDKNKKEQKPDAKNAEKKPEGKPRVDPQIKNALEKINQDLKERTPIPEAAQVKEGGLGSPLGNAGGSNSECDQYSIRVKQRIVGNWIRLVGTNKPPRPPKIYISLNSSGQIISTQFLQKSGDLSLDNSAERAVQNSSPLPVPPQNCEMALRTGITVQFGR